jgi:large subunit ribosomal protein LP0
MAVGKHQGKQQRQYKQLVLDKIKALFSEYPKFLIVGADNVSSSLLHKVRHGLRGHAVIMMGKNTMMRKALRELVETNSVFESILPLVTGNVGFVFTKGDLSFVRAKLLEYSITAPAKVGTVAPNDVVIPKGPTGMEPSVTSFLQALQISSRINRGQVDIINDVYILKRGDRVGSSEAALLNKLSIKPFTYSLQVLHAYDDGHSCAHMLDWTNVDFLQSFANGVSTLASLSLEIGYPTMASLPHSLVNAYKDVLAVSMATDYSFEAAQQIKDYLANPRIPLLDTPIATEVHQHSSRLDDIDDCDCCCYEVDLFGDNPW